MDLFDNNIFQKIAAQASRLACYNKKLTITSREIQAAILLLFPRELTKHNVYKWAKTIIIINSFDNAIFEKITAQGLCLGHYNERTTLASGEKGRSKPTP